MDHLLENQHFLVPEVKFGSLVIILSSFIEKIIAKGHARM